MDADAVPPGRLPSGWWKQYGVANQLGSWFRRHIVLLQVVAGYAGKPYPGVYTGFFLERRGALYWVTAGHCVEDMEKHRANPALAACWVDNHKVDAARSIPVADPAALLETPVKSSSCDVGVLRPSLHEERLFRANPDYDPLKEAAWEGKSKATPEGLYVIGFPDEWRTDTQTETAETYDLLFTAAIASLPIVERLDPNHGTGEFWGHENCIYGRVALPQGSPGRALENMTGMSGGPVLSVECVPGKGIRYHLFGVQSAWLRKSCIVRAESIEAVIELIDAVMRQG